MLSCGNNICLFVTGWWAGRPRDDLQWARAGRLAQRRARPPALPAGPHVLCAARAGVLAPPAEAGASRPAPSVTPCQSSPAQRRPASRRNMFSSEHLQLETISSTAAPLLALCESPGSLRHVPGALHALQGPTAPAQPQPTTQSSRSIPGPAESASVQSTRSSQTWTVSAEGERQEV